MDILALLSSADSLLAAKIGGGENEEIVTIAVKAVVPKAEVERVARAATPERVKAAPVTLPPVSFVPCYSTATIFLLSLKRAGFRPSIDPVTGTERIGTNGAPIFVRDATKVRDDEVTAIALFTGYDRKVIHGVQLEAARRRALLLVKPYLGGDGKVARTAPIFAGYVAGNGATQAQDRLLGDLNAKLRVCVDLKCKTVDKGDLAQIDAMIAGLHKQIDMYR